MSSGIVSKDSQSPFTSENTRQKITDKILPQDLHFYLESSSLKMEIGKLCIL